MPAAIDGSVHCSPETAGASCCPGSPSALTLSDLLSASEMRSGPVLPCLSAVARAVYSVPTEQQDTVAQVRRRELPHDACNPPTGAPTGQHSLSPQRQHEYELRRLAALSAMHGGVVHPCIPSSRRPEVYLDPAVANVPKPPPPPPAPVVPTVPPAAQPRTPHEVPPHSAPCTEPHRASQGTPQAVPVAASQEAVRKRQERVLSPHAPHAPTIQLPCWPPSLAFGEVDHVSGRTRCCALSSWRGSSRAAGAFVTCLLRSAFAVLPMPLGLRRTTLALLRAALACLAQRCARLRSGGHLRRTSPSRLYPAELSARLDCEYECGGPPGCRAS